MTNSKCGNELLSVNYTLQPLIDEVADPLVCFSEDKIKKVTPTEIHVSFYNSNNSHIIIQGNNAFETLHKINLHPAKKNIGFARFKVLTADGQSVPKFHGIFPRELQSRFCDGINRIFRIEN